MFSIESKAYDLYISCCRSYGKAGWGNNNDRIMSRRAVWKYAKVTFLSVRRKYPP